MDELLDVVCKKKGIGDFHHFNQFQTFDLGAHTHTYIYRERDRSATILASK